MLRSLLHTGGYQRLYHEYLSNTKCNPFQIGSRPTSTIELLEALRNLRNRYQSSNTRVFYDADAVNPELLESEHMAKLYRR